jgi:SAM-dependent methyltransferase
MNDIDYTLHYSKYHDDSKAHELVMAHYFGESLAEFLPAGRDEPVLEIGCGAGFALKALIERGYKNLTGIDVDSGQVAAAVARGMPALHVRGDDLSAFVEAHDRKFRLIFAFDVLEHVPVSEQIQFVQAAVAMLAPNGVFVCQVPNALSPVASYQRYIDWTHHAAFTVDSLEFLLRLGGMEPMGIRSSIDPNPLSHGPKRLVVGGAKALLRLVVRGAWRSVLMSEVGLNIALKQPVSRNFIMFARANL